MSAGKAWARGYRDAISVSQIFDASECNGEQEHKAYYAGHVAGCSDARAARIALKSARAAQQSRRAAQSEQET
jgi:hypothetical protein